MSSLRDYARSDLRTRHERVQLLIKQDLGPWWVGVWDTGPSGLVLCSVRGGAESFGMAFSHFDDLGVTSTTSGAALAGSLPPEAEDVIVDVDKTRHPAKLAHGVWLVVITPNAGLARPTITAQPVDAHGARIGPARTAILATPGAR